MQIHGKVFDMDSALVEVGANQRHANHGIYILCKAVGELMQGSNIPSRAELLEFTQHPIWKGDRLQVRAGFAGLDVARGTWTARGPSSARDQGLPRAGAQGLEGILADKDAGGKAQRPFLLGNRSASPESVPALPSTASEDESSFSSEGIGLGNLPFLSARSLNGSMRMSRLGQAW